MWKIQKMKHNAETEPRITSIERSVMSVKRNGTWMENIPSAHKRRARGRLNWQARFWKPDESWRAMLKYDAWEPRGTISLFKTMREGLIMSLRRMLRSTFQSFGVLWEAQCPPRRQLCWDPWKFLQGRQIHGRSWELQGYSWEWHTRSMVWKTELDETLTGGARRTV